MITLAFMAFTVFVMHSIYKHTFYFHWFSGSVEDNINPNTFAWVLNFALCGSLHVIILLLPVIYFIL